MAGIKAPLQDILTKLATINVTNPDGNTIPLYSRVWNNQVQLNKEGQLYDFPKPAAFVEFITPVSFTEIGGNFRSADLGINIHLVHEYYNADGTFEQDLLVFDLRDKVVAALSQFKPTGCGQMVSNGDQQDFDHDNIYHYIISFFCDFTDSKGSPLDPDRNTQVTKEPPTDLALNVDVDTEPVFNPTIQEYKIPKQ